MVKWLWWSRGPNYEEELPRLADQIKKYSAKLITVRASHRRWKGITVLTLLLAYMLELCYYVGFGSSGTAGHTNNHYSLLAVPGQWRYLHVVAGPLVAYLIYTTLARALGWRERRLAASLEQLKVRHRNLINEYKKKINFDQIQKLVQEPNQEPDNTSQSKKKQAQDGKTLNARGRGTATKPPNAPSAQVNTAGAASDAPQYITGTNPAGAPPISTTSYLNTHSPQNTLNGKYINQPGTEGAIHGNIANFVPLPIYHTTWVDRIMDLILGENEQSPTQRYALICNKCHVHNGLAPFGKTADEVTYICPVCGTRNGPKNGLKLGGSHEDVQEDHTKRDLATDNSNSTDNNSVQQEENSTPSQSPSETQQVTQNELPESTNDSSSSQDPTPIIITSDPSTPDSTTSVSKQSHPDLRKRKV